MLYSNILNNATFRTQICKQCYIQTSDHLSDCLRPCVRECSQLSTFTCSGHANLSILQCRYQSFLRYVTEIRHDTGIYIVVIYCRERRQYTFSYFNVSPIELFTRMCWYISSYLYLFVRLRCLNCLIKYSD